MKKTLTIIGSVIGTSGVVFAALISTSFQLPLNWIGGGAENQTSASFEQTASVGQPAAGTITTGNIVNQVGFIQSFNVSAVTTESEEINAIANCATLVNSNITCTVSPASGDIDILFPAQSFSQSINITLDTPTSFAPPQSSLANLSETNIGVDITGTSTNPRRPITITIRYREADIGSLNENQLTIVYYDRTTGQWLPLETTRDLNTNTLQAQSPYLGTYQVMAVTPGNKAVAYPSPFRAGQGNLRIANIPAFAEIDIFNLSGDLIRTVLADGSGVTLWNGQNGRGEKIRSGLYLFRIKSGASIQTLKVMVEN